MPATSHDALALTPRATMDLCGACSTPPPNTTSTNTMDTTVLPPAISGGTLLVAADGQTAVAADPDRDTVWVVDLATRSLITQVPLQVGDEPGRVIQDSGGRTHVVLRRGGALLTLAPSTYAVQARRAVCPAPRGVTQDPTSGDLYVVCVGGELVALPANPGAGTTDGSGITVTRFGDSVVDLRDVVVWKGRVFATRLRNADVFELNPATSTTVQRIHLPDTATHSANAARRAVFGPSGALYVLHERHSTTGLPTNQYYGAGSTAALAISTDVSVLAGPDGPAAIVGPDISQASLAVDFAFSPDGSTVAIVAAGNVPSSGTPQLLTVSTSDLNMPAAGTLNSLAGVPGTEGLTGMVAVAYDGSGRIVVQTREPAALYVLPGNTPITLPGPSRYDAGHDLFHAATRAGLTCAGCHVEGGDDGHAWTFVASDLRRTMNLLGGISSDKPFHWDGSMPDMLTLMTDVFTERMGGPVLTQPEVDSVERWLNALPAIPPSPSAAPDAIARGQALFQSAQAQCSTCHNGPRFSDHTLVSVGTGGTFKVPPLVSLAARGPYMHDGCAQTLADRFTACGGSAHGGTSSLTAAQISDLIAYLGSL